jgi:hypothetical protein
VLFRPVRAAAELWSGREVFLRPVWACFTALGHEPVLREIWSEVCVAGVFRCLGRGSVRRWLVLMFWFV